MFANGETPSALRTRTKTRQSPSAVTRAGATTKTAFASTIRITRRLISPPARTLASGGLTSCRSRPNATPGRPSRRFFAATPAGRQPDAGRTPEERPANRPPNGLSASNRQIHRTRINTRRTRRTGTSSSLSSLAGDFRLNLVRSVGYGQKSAPARKTASRTPAEKLEKYAKGLEKPPIFHVIRLEKHQKSMKKSLPNRQGGKARDANSAGGIAP